MIREVDDVALPRAFDRGMGRVHEALQPLRAPMIAPRLPARFVHPLLDDDPLPIIGHDETVEVKVEAILDGGAVHLGDKPAGARERVTVEADTLADRAELLRRPARCFPRPPQT